MTRFLLDTNTISYIARGRSVAARRRLEEAQEIHPVCASVVTEGEILYGLLKRPAAHQVAFFMYAALAGLKILPWNSAAASAYAVLRVENERVGKVVGSHWTF